jgi:uncharacterized SAM-binding protein YcdF (DUF218 family)
MILRLMGRRKKRRPLSSLLLLLLLGGATGVWAYREVKIWLTPPEAIFVLGGHESREHFAAELAQKHPDLPIWVSSGSPERYIRKIFAKAGVNLERLHLEYKAKDTVTNFTTAVEELKAHNINSVYLVTSENHMGRSRLVGEIIFGSQGILIKPVAVPSEATPEPLEKYLRDGVRAVLWLATGSTGENTKLLSNPFQQ